ncbi:MAG: DNA repair protein RadC [Bacteroidetes bacterium]|nr:DNA repair protein RadC [Bacteroidota bacterium]
MKSSEFHEPPRSYLKIKDLPEDDRPREKALKHGIHTLSDSELLAILINTGTKQFSAMDIAKDVLRKYGTLSSVATLSPEDLKRSLKGIGKAKAVKILASFELARRLRTAQAASSKSIMSPGDIAELYIPRLCDERQELFLVVCLSTAKKIIRDRVITKGLLNSSLIHPREVFREAILENSNSVILIHNHPSGNLEPSSDDIAVTKQLVEAGKKIGIEVDDHIIIAGNGYTSFVERGLL